MTIRLFVPIYMAVSGIRRLELHAGHFHISGDQIALFNFTSRVLHSLIAKDIQGGFIQILLMLWLLACIADLSLFEISACHRHRLHEASRFL